jgi:hypothetical protein
MKIDGPQKSQQSSQSKKKDKVKGGDGSFGDLVSRGAEGAKGASATQSIAKVDSLLAVQATDDPAQRSARKRMLVRAEGLLGELDNLKTALLTGSLTVGHVLDIADVVASHREKITDPELTAILDEIDLRAQIEIAKLRKALDNKPV